MSFNTLHIPGIAEEPLIPPRGQPIRNATVMIDNDLDDPIPRSRSNPIFETLPRLPNEIRDDTLPPTVPGLSSMFQRAHEVDIGGNPSFVNGNVYHYNHYNHVTRNLAQISSVDFAARRNERRADIIKQLGEEVKELNQLLQEKTEELSRMEDTANRQNAKQTEDIKQLEAELTKLKKLLQKKTEELSLMEDAAKQQNAKQTEAIKRLEADVRRLDQLLQEKTAKLASLEEAAYLQNAKQAEDTKRLEAELRKLNQLLREKTEELSRVEDTANRQNAKQAIDLGQANTEVRKLNQLLQEKTVELASLEEVANRQKQEIGRLEGKHEKEIQRFEAVIEGLQTKLSSMEHVAFTKHMQEIERLKGNHEKGICHLEGKYEKGIGRLEREHEKEICHLEAVVASMSKQASKLEKEIGRLQTKVSTEEDAKQPKKRQVQDHPKSPNEKPQATKHSSTASNRKINRSAQQPGVKKEPLQIPSPSIQTNILPPPAVVPKAETLSVTDVANLVKALNAEIGQTVNLLMDSLSDLGLPSDNKFEIASDELRNYLGPGLCDKLEGKSEIDPLITQLALQMGLVNACSSVVNDSPFFHNGSIHQTLYNRMAEKESQAAADEWRAKTFNYFDLPQCEDANKKYLTEVLLKLTTAAAGGTMESNKSLLSQYNQQLEAIAKSAAKLHKTITEDVRSAELITFTISCDTEFDASRMEDVENTGSTPHGKVICTHEMGLLCRKRVEPKNGPLKDWGSTTKAKVILASMLEE